MWSVAVLKENGRFVVRTVLGDETQDMTFSLEGFANLYARGQRVHFQTLTEIAADENGASLYSDPLADSDIVPTVAT